MGHIELFYRGKFAKTIPLLL